MFYRALTDVSFDFPSGPPPWLSELYATLNQGGGENGKPKETPAGPPPWLTELYATLNQGGGENGKPKETPAN